jgi:hypothetical protein
MEREPEYGNPSVGDEPNATGLEGSLMDSEGDVKGSWTALVWNLDEAGGPKRADASPTRGWWSAR